MARSSSTSQKQKSGSARKAQTPAQKRAQQASREPARPRSAADRAPLLDARAKRDIAGVACAVLAVALFVVATVSTTGVVTGALSQALHLGLGLGCYLLPFFLVLVAASLFFRKDGQRVSARVSVGLLILFVCVLVMLALYTPGLQPQQLDYLFLRQNLITQGGYVGAGVAWALYLLFGQVVSTVIVIGVMAIALIIIGFSISALVEKVRAKRAEREAQLEAMLGAYPAMPAGADGQPASTMPQRARTSRPSVRKRADAREERPSARMRLAARGQQDVAQEGVTAALPLQEGEPRAERASRAAATRRLAQEAQEGQDGPAKTAALTRKLGRQAQDASAGEAPVAAKAARAAQKRPAASTSTPRPQEDFKLPSMSLLKKTAGKKGSKDSDEVLRDTAMLLQDTLSDFGVEANVVGWAAGPTVTLFKVALPSGVRVSRVTNLTDDIALAMASQGVRIFSPIPGTNYVGIEVPNVKRASVLLGDVLPSAGKGPLEVAVGKDVEGNPIVSDLAKMPHLLIGGTTGSGKSVSINGMIMSILMRATPAEVRFIMIDPKRVEFTPYNGIPHLYVPVVTECSEASAALSWAVAEMERRLKVFSKVGVRNIGQYNAKAQAGMQIGDEQADELPFIVIIIDELADLMMNVGKEVEFSISRLAQLARAAGIHMIVATQRPSANVVTGLIKANITNRIAFNVASSIDSRVILDTPGAENLIGWGDMLLSKPEYAKPQRLQGCLVTEDEIASVVEHLKSQGEPEYHTEILSTNVITLGASAPDGSGGTSTADDPLIWEAADIVVSTGLGSTSNIQRRLKVGYSRAGRIMDMLEEKGIVGPPNGSKPRDVLVDALELESLKAFEANDSE